MARRRPAAARRRLDDDVVAERRGAPAARSCLCGERVRAERLGDPATRGVVVGVVDGGGAVGHREARGVEADALGSAPDDQHRASRPVAQRRGRHCATRRRGCRRRPRPGGAGHRPGRPRACGRRTGRGPRRPPCLPTDRSPGRSRTRPACGWSSWRTWTSDLAGTVRRCRRTPPTARRPSGRHGRAATPLPTSRTCATHSWPIANGPLNGTRPQMQPTTGSMARAAMPACIRRDTGRWIGRVSPSQRAATKGRTIASRGSLRVGASRSRQARRPLRMNASSRTRVILAAGRRRGSDASAHRRGHKH